MKYFTKTIAILFGLIILVSSIACSDSESSPTMPDPSLELAAVSGMQSDGTQVWGAYHMTFDPETQEITCVENREAAKHFNITKFVSPHMEVNFKYHNILVGDYCFEIKLTNPTHFMVYDVRAIVVPDPWAPIVFINPDDYTKHFDWIAEQNVNGFRAFSKSASKRAFIPYSSNTQTFVMNSPYEYANPSEWDILITCSIPGNATDPYEINVQPMQFPVDNTFWSEIRVQVLDWQNDVEHVTINTLPINGGIMELQREGTSNWWRGLIKNQTGAAPGFYPCIITADSSSWDCQEPDPDECLYEIIQIEVQ